MNDSPPGRHRGDAAGYVLAETSRLPLVPGSDPLLRACAIVLARGVRSVGVMPSSARKALASLRAVVDGALAQGSRALEAVRADWRDERAYARAPAEVFARWANVPLVIEELPDDAEGDAELRSLVVGLVRDTGILQGAGAVQSRTRRERLASIGTAWTAAGVAGAADGLFGSQLPSIAGGVGLYLGSYWADAEWEAALLQASRGVFAAAIYTAARDAAATARRPSQSLEAAR